MARDFWFDGPPSTGACACGSYTCDGLCDSFLEYRRQEKEEESFYDWLESLRCPEHPGETATSEGTCPTCGEKLFSEED
jgi:hypothetical protein